MRKLTQENKVLIWLKERGTINPLQALREIGCFRLAAVIHRLKKRGYNIITKRITKQGRFGKVSFGEYHLEGIK